MYLYEQCQQPKNKEINMIVLNDHSPNGLFRDNEKKKQQKPEHVN